jgi:hypothetical protein
VVWPGLPSEDTLLFISVAKEISAGKNNAAATAEIHLLFINSS